MMNLHAFGQSTPIGLRRVTNLLSCCCHIGIYLVQPLSPGAGFFAFIQTDFSFGHLFLITKLGPLFPFSLLIPRPTLLLECCLNFHSFTDFEHIFNTFLGFSFHLIMMIIIDCWLSIKVDRLHNRLNIYYY